MALVVWMAGCGGNPEANLIGTWKVSSSALDLPSAGATGNSAQQMSAKMAKQMMSNVTLELKNDKTYVMTMMFPMEGTWSFADNLVTLNMTKMMGMDLSKMPNANKAPQKPMTCQLSADGKQLTLQSEGAKANPTSKSLVFEKQ